MHPSVTPSLPIHRLKSNWTNNKIQNIRINFNTLNANPAGPHKMPSFLPPLMLCLYFTAASFRRCFFVSLSTFSFIFIKASSLGFTQTFKTIPFLGLKKLLDCFWVIIFCTVKVRYLSFAAFDRIWAEPIAALYTSQCILRLLSAVTSSIHTGFIGGHTHPCVNAFCIFSSSHLSATSSSRCCWSHRCIPSSFLFFFFTLKLLIS